MVAQSGPCDGKKNPSRGLGVCRATSGSQVPHNTNSELQTHDRICTASFEYLGIGNGVGKQGGGNQPPYRRYGPDTEIQYRSRKPHGLAKPSRTLSKRKLIRNFSIDPTSSIRTSIADSIFADAISETPRVGSNCGRPQRGGTNLGVFVPIWPVINPGIVMTGHIRTSTPKFVPPRCGRPPFDPTQTGLCKFGRGFGAR